MPGESEPPPTELDVRRLFVRREAGWFQDLILDEHGFQRPSPRLLTYEQFVEDNCVLVVALRGRARPSSPGGSIRR